MELHGSQTKFRFQFQLFQVGDVCTHTTSEQLCTDQKSTATNQTVPLRIDNNSSNKSDNNHDNRSDHDNQNQNHSQQLLLLLLSPPE
jgi:hypothetical protein